MSANSRHGRKCAICNGYLGPQCMGGCWSNDVSDWIEGKIDASDIRESCPMCILGGPTWYFGNAVHDALLERRREWNLRQTDQRVSNEEMPMADLPKLAIVPIEPTADMLKAANTAFIEWASQPKGTDAHGPVWRAIEAMCAASTVAVSLEEIVEVLTKALPLVEQAEFLESCSYSYGCGGSEPSPAEWGISVGFQQTREAMPYTQYEAAVDRFHRENRDEDEDGKFLTEANKLRSLITRIKSLSEKGE